MPAPAIPGGVLDEFRAAVGEGNVRIGEAVAELDPGQHLDNLRAGVVVSPGSTAEVAAVVQVCAAHLVE